MRLGMRKNDKWSSILCFFIGLGFIAGGIKMGLGPLNAPGAGFFPAAIGGIFSILSLALLIAASLGKNHGEEKKPFWKGEKSWVKVSLALLALVFYLIFLDYLGYLLTTVLFMFFLLRFVGKKGWTVSICTAVLVSLGSYALFRIALGVPLPRGLITW
jgi:putative tricarboxylic transport membrane protein